LEKACVWVPALIESAVILAKNGRYPGDWNRLILGHFGGPTRGAFVAGHLSKLVLVGAAVAVAGTSFRTAAYRALGRHFTYELALKKEHTLIKGFPYTVVRHPSYTGWLVTYAGVGLALAAPRDGWLRAVFFPWVTNGPVTSTKVAAVGGAVLAFGALSFMLPLIKSRVDVEDEMLHEQFGQEWEDWARRVPYQVVPFVM
jgi:protein-S-isoprenylcysteine O-methyltransferase Ste14